MSLASQIVSAVNQAKASLGDLVITATVTKVTNVSYSTTTLNPTQTSASPTVDGFVSQWDEDELDGEKVRSDDVKFYVFPTTVEIAHGDTVSFDGTKYSVERVSPVKAGIQTALTLVQLRK